MIKALWKISFLMGNQSLASGIIFVISNENMVLNFYAFKQIKVIWFA